MVKQFEEMPVKVKPHPAKFSEELYDQLRAAMTYSEVPGWILDPFAGVGRIHSIFDDPTTPTLAIELEWEWAEQAALLGETWCGDFFDWVPDRKISAVVTSPTYGNRMADHHEAKDESYRATYRHALGRALSPNNSGGMQWGVEYRSFHIKAWAKVYEILAGGGLFVLNIKDHIRKNEQVEVTAWHEKRLLALGFTLLERFDVMTPGMRRGENDKARVDHESILIYWREKTESTWDKTRQERRSNLSGAADDRYLAGRAS